MQRFQTRSYFYRDFNLGLLFHQFTPEAFSDNLDTVLCSCVHDYAILHTVLWYAMSVDTATVKWASEPLHCH